MTNHRTVMCVVITGCYLDTRYNKYQSECGFVIVNAPASCSDLETSSLVVVACGLFDDAVTN